MKKMTGRVLFVSLVVSICAFVQTAAAQTALKGGTVHTVSGDVIEEGVVVIGEDGKIAAVGDASTAIPKGAKVVDVSGKVVTPGLVEAHTSLGAVEIWAVGNTRDNRGAGGDPVRAGFRVQDGFNPNSVVIPITRTGGVTSAVVVPGGGLISGQAAWAKLGPQAGQKTFGHVDQGTAAMVINYGEGGANAAGGSRGAAMESLRELYTDLQFYRANRGKYDENRARKLAASRLDFESLAPTLDGGLPVLIRAHRASDIRAALAFSDEFGLRPIIVGGAEAWMVADELAAENVPVVVDPMLNLPRRFESLGARADNAALLVKAGVPVILSTFDTHNARKLRQAAGNAVRAGLSHAAALEAITAAPARALGRDDIGAIEAGDAADLVVWSGDPFELSTRAEMIFVEGEQVSLDNRQRQLLEKYRELPRRAKPAAQN